MNQALNQDELDSLLKKPENEGAADTNSNSAEPKSYDLANHDKSIYSRIATLGLVNEKFARNIRISLHNFLRKPIEVILLGLKICRFEEYINTLFIPTSINVVKMSPLKGAALFVADAKLVFALVENYFGGEGKVHYNKEASEFTLIEQRIVKMMLDFFFKDLKEAWSSLLDVQFEYKAMEVNPAIANIMNLSDLIIVSRFRFELEGGGGDFQICLPYSMIEPIQELLSAGIKIEKQESDDEWLKHIREEVLKVDIDINCVLTQKKITLKDVMRFKNGDVINIEIPEEITLKVNEIPMFTANFGTFEGKYSVKIVDKIKKTEKR